MAVLYLRNVPDAVARRVATAAAARGITNPEYIARLVELHSEMMRLSGPAGDGHEHQAVCRELLEGQGLQAVNA